MQTLGLTHHAAAAGVAGVLQVAVQQFCGSVLEGFGQSSQQHGELGRVELKQRDEHHLSRLQAQESAQEGEQSHGVLSRNSFTLSWSVVLCGYTDGKK